MLISFFFITMSQKATSLSLYIVVLYSLCFWIFHCPVYVHNYKYLHIYSCKNLSRACKWDWNCWTIGCVSIELYKKITNFFPKCLCKECNCVAVWGFFDIALLWDWNENWSFAVLWPLLSFPNWLTYWVQHF